MGGADHPAVAWPPEEAANHHALAQVTPGGPDYVWEGTGLRDIAWIAYWFDRQHEGHFETWEAPPDARSETTLTGVEGTTYEYYVEANDLMVLNEFLIPIPLRDAKFPELTQVVFPDKDGDKRMGFAYQVRGKSGWVFQHAPSTHPEYWKPPSALTDVILIRAWEDKGTIGAYDKEDKLGEPLVPGSPQCPVMGGKFCFEVRADQPKGRCVPASKCKS